MHGCGCQCRRRMLHTTMKLLKSPLRPPLLPKVVLQGQWCCWELVAPLEDPQPGPQAAELQAARMSLAARGAMHAARSCSQQRIWRQVQQQRAMA